MRRRLITLSAALAATALLNAGCATSMYTPRPSRRIARIDGNEHHFIREGQRFELGLVGDAEALVRGNAVAETYARRYRRDQIAGVAVYGLSLGLTATGVALWGRGGDGQTPAGAICLTTGLFASLIALPFIFIARANLIDAVNIYNDGLEPP